jgi:hypothetical protein
LIALVRTRSYRHKPMANDSHAPATKADITLVLEALNKTDSRFDRVDAKLDLLDRRTLRSERDIDRILTILVDMKTEFSSTTDYHDKRIKRLEKKEGLAPLAA